MNSLRNPSRPIVLQSLSSEAFQNISEMSKIHPVLFTWLFYCIFFLYKDLVEQNTWNSFAFPIVFQLHNHWKKEKLKDNKPIYETGHLSLFRLKSSLHQSSVSYFCLWASLVIMLALLKLFVFMPWDSYAIMISLIENGAFLELEGY